MTGFIEDTRLGIKDNLEFTREGEGSREMTIRTSI